MTTQQKNHSGKKFENLLFCTDLDGTLYRSDKTVSRENQEAIEYFKAEGGLFTFITGRVPLTAQHICQTIRPNAPYGCINGGGIFDNEKGDYLWRTTLPPEAMCLVDAVDAQLPDIGIQLNTEKAIYFNKYNTAIERFRRGTGLPDLHCHYRQVEEPVLKVLFAHDDEAQILALSRLLAQHPYAAHVDFIRSEHHLYEILPKGVSKGAALQKMAQLLNIPPENTIAAGDYDNDISMLRQAGLSFAVANAVDGAKAAADHITVSNNDHAIAAIIHGLDQGLYPIP